MSRAGLSMACAGLVLAAGALAASGSADAPGAGASVASQAAAAKAARSTTVTVFLTVRDAQGNLVAKPSARVEGPDGQDWGVGPEGVKLSMPAGVPPEVLVLVPSAKCKVTLTAAQAAGGSVTIALVRGAAGTQCAAAAGRPAAAASPASAASAAGKDKHASGLLGAIF